MRGKEHHGGAVRHLPAVVAPHASLDDGVRLVILGEAALVELPLARLGIGIAARVLVVDAGDLAQMVVADAAIFLGVGIDQVGEGRRPDVSSILPFPSMPRCGAEIFRSLLSGNIAHIFDAEHADDVVAPGFDLRRCGEHRHRT